MRYALPLALVATPALAAGEKGFFSLANTDFIVLIAFIVFVAFLVYMNVPSQLMGMLDKRADSIRSELDEARKLREDAQAVLASYERKSREAEEQAKRIVENARRDAEEAAEQAKVDLRASVERRIKGAEDRIASAEAAAVKAVRDKAIQVAVAAASEVIGEQMDGGKRDQLIDQSIDTVSAKLH